MKPFLTLAILFLSLSMGVPQTKYELSTFEADEKINLAYNKFYFVHYLYMYAFRPFGLDKSLDLKSKKKIFRELYGDLSHGRAKELAITTMEPMPLRIRFKLYRSGKDLSLILFCNYDTHKRKIVPIDSAPDYFYAKQYYISGNKLVPSKIFFNRENGPKIIEQYLKEKNYNALADYVLDDVNATNDKDAVKYIEKGLRQKGSLLEKLIMKFTLCEYYLLTENFEKFEILFKEIEGAAPQLKDKKRKKS